MRTATGGVRDDQIFVLCCCTAIVMLGVGIVSPILPLYAETFGVSYFLVGMVVSSFGMARILTDMPAGYLAGRVGRRPLLLFGLCLFTISAILAVVASSYEYLIAFRVVQGVGAAIFTTSAMTCLVDIVPEGQRTKYMGRYQGAIFVGLALGPAVGGFLAELGGFRAPFLSLFFLAAMSLVLAGAKISESLPARERGTISHGDSVSALRRFFRNRNLIIGNCAGAVIFITIGGIRMTAIPLYGQQAIHLSAGDIGIILALGAFSNFLVLLLTGAMTDRFGMKPLLICGFALIALACYSFSFSGDFLSMTAASVLLGAASGTVNPGQVTIVIDSSEVSLSVGMSRVFSDVGLILGPLLVGVLSDQVSLTSPFLAAAFLSLLVAASISLLK